MVTLRFDDSLPAFVRSVVSRLNKDVIASSVFLRDVSGRLSLFVGGQPLGDEAEESLSGHLRPVLGPYANPDRIVIGSDRPGAPQVLTSPAVRELSIDGIEIRYLDHRIVGADWLRQPVQLQATPPRFVFASLKGGVGRSTAISVIAAEQSRVGRNVLVVDLDLEAPGIGSMLLDGDRVPAYGSLDYLVEKNLGPISGSALGAFVGTSALTAGAGLVDVVPVVGTASRAAPANYLSKLSRAMLEDLSDATSPLTPLGKAAAFLSELEARRHYDLVLIDAWAGLAELAAGPLLGFGATILFFGTAQAQTIEGLRYLFAHLATLMREGEGSPWRDLKMIHAKAHQVESHVRFKDALWDLFTEFLYEEQEGLTGLNFNADDPEAPHNPIVVPLDSAFADWDPVDKPSSLVESYYARAFGALLEFVNSRVSEGAA